MARKVFLSFLGVYSYEELNYSSKNKTYRTKFAPVAAIKFLIDIENYMPDTYYVFVTEKAKKNYEALKNDLKKINFNINNLVQIEIENETHEKKLWDNFEKVYSVLRKEDQIVFDITYGFRATPMLLTTLLNYAKILKHVQVYKIYYGAYEKGVDNALIWDLTDFSTIQDLAISTDEFVNYNIPHNFIQFFDENLKEKIRLFAGMFSTNRSLDIYDGKIAEELKKELNIALSSKPNAFNELKIILETKLSKFEANEIRNNGLNAVKFCIDAELIQQAITILQELIVTIIILDINEDYKKEAIRNIVSSVLSIKDKTKIKKEKINTKDLGEQKIDEILDKTYSLNYKEKLTKLYIKFSMSVRNDINHAGLRENPRNSLEFKEKINNYYEKFKDILQFK